MREADVRKKERNEILLSQRPEAKNPLSWVLKCADKYQTASPVCYTLQSPSSNCVSSSCRKPPIQSQLHRFADRRCRCNTRGKRLKDFLKVLAHAQPCQNLCRLIDVACTHHRQDSTKGIGFDLGVLEFALEVVGPSLALRNVVSAFELALDAVCACGSGAGAFRFSMLAASAGTSHLDVIFALGRFFLVFG